MPETWTWRLLLSSCHRTWKLGTIYWKGPVTPMIYNHKNCNILISKFQNWKKNWKSKIKIQSPIRSDLKIIYSRLLFWSKITKISIFLFKSWKKVKFWIKGHNSHYFSPKFSRIFHRSFEWFVKKYTWKTDKKRETINLSAGANSCVYLFGRGGEEEAELFINFYILRPNQRKSLKNPKNFDWFSKP